MVLTGRFYDVASPKTIDCEALAIILERNYYEAEKPPHSKH